MKPKHTGNAVFPMMLVAFWSVTILAGGVEAADMGMKQMIVTDAVFSTPESVEYYAAEDVYLVTNINGSPFAADGNGFVSKLKPDGSVMDLKWIDGEKQGTQLNAPKGAAIVGNNLFIADINQVQVFQLPGGKQTASITIKGSTFLNGITPGAGDYVYVTDSGFNEGFKPSDSDAVYKVWADGKVETVTKGKDMGHPNGIIADGDKLMIVTFGSSQLISVDAEGLYSPVATPPNGGLDGLLKMDDGSLVMSSWGGSAIYAMSKDKTFSVLADSLDAPADLGFDSKRNRILIPLFKQNKVVLLPR